MVKGLTKLKRLERRRPDLHMVMVISPKYAIAAVIGELKSQSASYLRKKYPWLAIGLLEGEHRLVAWLLRQQMWGFGEQMIKRYVVNQGKQDLGQIELEI